MSGEVIVFLIQVREPFESFSQTRGLDFVGGKKVDGVAQPEGKQMGRNIP